MRYRVRLGSRIGASVCVVAALSLAWSAGSSAATFSNSASIAIPSEGAATPYPSAIKVTGLTGRVADVNVTLNGVSHGRPDDIGAALFAPNGNALNFLGAAGGDTDASNLNLTFDDQAAGLAPNTTALATGSYRPTVHASTITFQFCPAAPFGNCTLAGSFNGENPNGTWELYVRDQSALPPPETGTISGGWTLDITTDPTPPTTTIDSGPSGTTSDATPTFAFSASEPSTFECRFDSAAYGPCSGPGASHTSVTPLPDGAHSFQVRATDSVGNIETSPPVRTFTVDTAPPAPVAQTPNTIVQLVTAPDTRAPVAAITGVRVNARRRSAVARFFAIDDVSGKGLTLECKLDARAFARCSSPKRFRHLRRGRHTLSVRATDVAGNVGISVIRRFAVRRPPRH